MKHATIIVAVLLCLVLTGNYIYSTPVYVGPSRTYTTIQAAIDSFPAGSEIEVYVDPGIYSENINEAAKKISIYGSGSGSNSTVDTIIRKGANQPIIRINVTGTAVSPVVFSDIRVEPNAVYGFEFPDGVTISYIEFDNVSIVGPATSALESEAGIWIQATASVDNITIRNSLLSQLDLGIYIEKQGDWGPGASNVTNFLMEDSEVSNIDYKGLYIEKLSDATFRSVVFNNNGLVSYWNDRWNAGVDINLKGEDYSNITFIGCTFTSNALGFRDGVALMIKARDDGATYGAHPATLTNVTIEDCTITNNERGIRFGEPDQGNATPSSVTVINSTIDGNVQTYSGSDGTEYGGVINYTLSTVDARHNYWDGTCNGPTHASNPGGTGDVVYGDVLFIPWNCASTPTARISTDPSPAVGFTTFDVEFDCTKSSSPHAAITDCTWNLGNGDNPSDFVVNTYYNRAGSYTARLTVTDSLSQTDTASIKVRAYDLAEITSEIVMTTRTLKAFGSESMTISIRLFHQGVLITDKLPISLNMLLGSTVGDMAFDPRTGRYSQEIKSGQVGDDTMNVILRGLVVGTAELYYRWVLPPSGTEIEIQNNSKTFIKNYIINLSWTPPAEEEDIIKVNGYRIYRVIGGAADYSLVAELSKDSYSFRDSVNSADFNYYIVSIDNMGDESEKVYFK